MEQFSLEKYLENPSRKVVTERNKEVRIICTDVNCAYPIVAGIKFDDDRETPLSYDINGKCPYHEGNNLFFADEEEELTEFEKAMVSFAHTMFDHLLDKSKEVDIKEWKENLIDLARKELQPEIDKEIDEDKNMNEFETRIYNLINFSDPYNYPSIEEVKEEAEILLDLAKEKILKDLPKWKKCDDNLPYSHIGGLNERYLIKKGYCMKISDLETLPKEE